MVFQRLFATLAISALVLSAETDYRFAFPQSEILLGMDIKWLMKSPFGSTMRTQVKANLGELLPLEALLDQIDAVYLSAASNTKKNSDLIMLLKGRFEEDKLLDLAANHRFRMEQWGKTKVLLQPRAKLAPSKKVRLQKTGLQTTDFTLPMPTGKPAFALYDNKSILIGEEACLRVALERMDTGLTPQGNPLFQRARDLEAANDLWLIGNTAPLNLNAATGTKSSDPMTQLASQVRNFSVGISIRRNLAMDLQLQTTSPKAATQILDLVKGAMAMAKMNSQPAETFPIDLDKAVQLSAIGSTLRASISVEQDEIDKLVASGLLPTSGKQKPSPKAQAPQVASATIPVAPPVAVKLAEPVRKTVIIYGLPGGPKEILVN